MECPNGCETPLEKQKSDKILYHFNEPIVISNLLMLTCPTCGQEEAINDAQPIKAWTMILATSGDSMDRLIREKKFQDKIGVDFNDWMDWKKIMDERHDS